MSVVVIKHIFTKVKTVRKKSETKNLNQLNYLPMSFIFMTLSLTKFKALFVRKYKGTKEATKN